MTAAAAVGCGALFLVAIPALGAGCVWIFDQLAARSRRHRCNHR